MHFTALKRFVFLLLSSTQFPIRKIYINLGWKVWNIQRPLQLNSSPEGGTPDFKWRGWWNGGKNQTKKIPGPKFIPQKIPCRISEPYQKFPESIKWCNTTNINISFECPKRSLLKSSYQKKILAKIFLPKESRKKYFLHPCHLKSGVQAQPLTPPSPPGNSSYKKFKNLLVTVNLNNKHGRLKRDFYTVNVLKIQITGGHLYKVLYHCWKILLFVYYCAFHKHANSEVQKPSDVCVFRCRQSSQRTS